MTLSKNRAKEKRNKVELLPTFKNTFHNIFRGPKSYLWFSFGIPVVIMYLIYLAMEIHPFGDGCVLVLDLNAQYVYFYEALRDFVHGDSSLLYSFYRQLGGEFMGIYAYYLASPFSYIVALFPKDRMLEALLTIFLLKTGLCGYTCGWYLHKTTPEGKRKKTTIVAFSLMYALCSYAIVQQNNSMWIDALIWLPVLTYSIEQMIKYRRFKLFVVSLAFTVMSNYYIGYMVCIYVALYFFYYYVAQSANGANNPTKEKTHFAKSLLRIITYSVIGIGISAVIVFTAYYSLTFGKNTFTDPSWELEIKFDLMDYLTKFLPGSYDTVRRAGLPFVYCGTLVLFMLPVYFMSHKVSNREKVMSGVMISIFSLSFLVSVIDLVWHGFQEPNWINYRYSFMLSFLLVTMAYKGFCDVESVSSKVHLATAAFISMFLIVAQKYVFGSYNSEDGAHLDPFQTILFTFICVAIYLSFLGVYRSSNRKKSMGILLTVIVSLEMFANGLSNVVGLANDVVYSTYSSYNNFMRNIRPIVDKVQTSDPSFYRMEKINRRKTNDNMGLSIRGLSNSSSTLNRETVEFLKHMGYSSAAHKTDYYGGNIVNDSLLGIRYVIGDNDDIESELNEHDAQKSMLERYYDLYATENGYNAYYNPYALSIAYGVSSNIYDFTFYNSAEKDKYYNPYQSLNGVITSMLGSDKEIEVFKPFENVEKTTQNCDIGYADKHTKYSPIDSSSSSYVTYTMEVPRDGDVYFYLPSYYPRKVSLTLNGDDYGMFYDSTTTRSMLLGYFSQGDTITLRLKLKSNVLYVRNDVPVMYYVDDDLFENCMNKLSETQLVIDDKYSEDHLTGTINTSCNNQTILTTIAYDEGWIIKVDGEPVDISKTFDALIAFDIADEGEHTIDMIYRPKAFTVGLTITIVSIVIFALLIIFEKRIYRFVYIHLYDETEESYKEFLSLRKNDEPIEYIGLLNPKDENSSAENQNSQENNNTEESKEKDNTSNIEDNEQK